MTLRAILGIFKPFGNQIFDYVFTFLNLEYWAWKLKSQLHKFLVTFSLGPWTFARLLLYTDLYI